MISVRMAQLYSLRAQVDALIALEEAEHVPVRIVDESTSGCEHPEDKRVDMTTMGSKPLFECLSCGAQVEGLA